MFATAGSVGDLKVQAHVFSSNSNTLYKPVRSLLDNFISFGIKTINEYHAEYWHYQSNGHQYTGTDCVKKKEKKGLHGTISQRRLGVKAETTVLSAIKESSGTFETVKLESAALV